VQEDILQGGTVHLQVADPHTARGELGEHGDGHATTGRQRNPDDLRSSGAGRLSAGAKRLPRGLPLLRVGHGQLKVVPAHLRLELRGAAGPNAIIVACSRDRSSVPIEAVLNAISNTSSRTTPAATFRMPVNWSSWRAARR
jgi:hypothetical protein